MKIFRRDAIHEHCVADIHPDFLGQVELGESFIIETEWDGKLSEVNGPVEVKGVKAGEAIAVYIENIEVLPPFYAPNGGPFVEGMGPPVPLEYMDGWFKFPNGLQLKANPSVGNIAVLPVPTKEVLEIAKDIIIEGGKVKIPHNRGWRRTVSDPRGKHCHQDCSFLSTGSRIHLKAQIDGVGLCASDVHGYIGQGEMAFAGLEVSADVQLRVERSKGWFIDWPLIETENEIMVFSSYTTTFPDRPQLKYVDVVREAYRSLREVVAARIGGSIEEVNSIVATATDLRNCAIYGLGEGYIPQHINSAPFDIAVVACLPKNVFSAK